MPRILISYSHDSPPHSGRVLRLANQLRADGIDCWIDQFEPHPAQGWPVWMEQQIARADFVLIVCSERYLARFNGMETPGIGLGVTWESILIRNELYQAGHENRKFIAVGLDTHYEKFIPARLRGDTHYLIDAFRKDSYTGYAKLYRHLTGQPEVEIAAIGDIVQLPSLAAISPSSGLKGIGEASQLLLHGLASQPPFPTPRYEAAYAMRFLGFDKLRSSIQHFIAINTFWCFEGVPASVKQRVMEDFRVQETGLPSKHHVPFALWVSQDSDRANRSGPEGNYPLVVVEGIDGLKSFLDDPLLYGSSSRLAKHAILRHVLFDEAPVTSDRYVETVDRVMEKHRVTKDLPRTAIFWGVAQLPAALGPAILGVESVAQMLRAASVRWE